MTTWIAIPGYEYEVSADGSVRRADTKRPVAQQFNSSGYLRVRLFKDGNMTRFFVHRLVMLAFRGDSELQVNHKNGDTMDNRLSNLEYCTCSENVKHSWRVLRPARTRTAEGRHSSETAVYS
jgi:hypothetical protein